MEKIQPEASAVAEIVKSLYEPKTVTLTRGGQDEASVLLVPTNSGLAVHSVKALLDPYRTAPERRKGTARLETLESFVEHTKRFADADTALFANPDPEEASLTTVFDYHRAGAEGAPRYGEHRAHYAFPLSDEWKAWAEKDGAGMSQADFSAFLEERLVDVALPEMVDGEAKALVERLGLTLAGPSALMTLARGLSVRVDSQITNAVRIESGETTLQYGEQHKGADGAPLKVPSAFLLTVRVFRGGAAYQLVARLRYRLAKGGADITWFYELSRVDQTFDHAITQAFERAQKETALPLFVGSPES